MRIVSVSELKASLASMVAQLEREAAPVYVTQHGKPKAVLVKYEEYEALQVKLEDLETALAMQQALAGHEEEALSLDEYDTGGPPSFAVRLRSRRVRRELVAMREPDHRRARRDGRRIPARRALRRQAVLEIRLRMDL